LNNPTEEIGEPILTNNISIYRGKAYLCFGGQNTDFTIIGVKIFPKNLSKSAPIGISQPNPRRRKTAINEMHHISVTDEVISVKFNRQIDKRLYILGHTYDRLQQKERGKSNQENHNGCGKVINGRRANIRSTCEIETTPFCSTSLLSRYHLGER